MGGKTLNGKLDMKLKLGFCICEENRESEETALPPIVDSTWQSPYIFSSLHNTTPVF